MLRLDAHAAPSDLRIPRALGVQGSVHVPARCGEIALNICAVRRLYLHERARRLSSLSSDSCRGRPSVSCFACCRSAALAELGSPKMAGSAAAGSAGGDDGDIPDPVQPCPWCPSRKSRVTAAKRREAPRL